jgi:hypothetical protein
MSQLNEELFKNDLENLVSHIFEVDSYKSKIGDDKDIVVLSFTIESLDAAKDLVNFIERGYDFILDADYTPGELNDGKYKVFAEIERTRRIPEQIVEMLDGMLKLTELDNFKFRYYKSFESIPATIENLKSTIPTSKEDYEKNLNEQYMNNFHNFFNRSYLDSINVDEDDIIFKKRFAEPLRMKIVNFGEKHEVFNNIEGKMMFEHKDIGEIVFLSKYIGEYNISKIGTSFIFENNNMALILKQV